MISPIAADRERIEALVQQRLSSKEAMLRYPSVKNLQEMLSSKSPLDVIVTVNKVTKKECF
jgi:hypothetical protein